MAAAQQQVADRRYGDVRCVHGDPRHHNRQRFAAAYRRQPVVQLRRRDLDADVVSCCERHRADHFRLAVERVRAQALLPFVHHGLHRVFVPVRHCRQPAATDRVPPYAGILRRRAATDPAGDHPRYISAGETQPGLRPDHDGHGHCTGDRSDAGRLHHRQRIVALGLSDQHSGWHRRHLRHHGVRRGPALGQAAAERRRLHRAGADLARPGMSAGDDGPRRGRGLVRRAVHRADGMPCLCRHRGRDRLAADRKETGGGHLRVRRPELRGGHGDDRSARLRALFQRRADPAIRAAGHRL